MIKWGEVTEDFIYEGSRLNLHGSPVGRHYTCSNNMLTSFKGAPKMVERIMFTGNLHLDDYRDDPSARMVIADWRDILSLWERYQGSKTLLELQRGNSYVVTPVDMTKTEFIEYCIRNDLEDYLYAIGNIS